MKLTNGKNTFNVSDPVQIAAFINNGYVAEEKAKKADEKADE